MRMVLASTKEERKQARQAWRALPESEEFQNLSEKEKGLALSGQLAALEPLMDRRLFYMLKVCVNTYLKSRDSGVRFMALAGVEKCFAIHDNAADMSRAQRKWCATQIRKSLANAMATDEPERETITEETIDTVGEKQS